LITSLSEKGYKIMPTKVEAIYKESEVILLKNEHKLTKPQIEAMEKLSKFKWVTAQSIKIDLCTMWGLYTKGFIDIRVKRYSILWKLKY